MQLFQFGLYKDGNLFKKVLVNAESEEQAKNYLLNHCDEARLEFILPKFESKALVKEYVSLAWEENQPVFEMPQQYEFMKDRNKALAELNARLVEEYEKLGGERNKLEEELKEVRKELDRRVRAVVPV